ncbi:MAG: autotransporter domain-containing protein [Alphaproteobacteria bacterium]|nr:autotransporter domain-containing protein [Alphaproteobacteria bacterium]
MSNTKHLADLLKVCSILPALVIMPAMGDGVSERQVITENKTYKSLTVNGIASSCANNGGVFYMEDVQDVVLNFQGNSSFTNNSLNGGGMGGVIGNGWLSTKDADKWTPYTPGGKIVFNGDVNFEKNTTNSTNGGGAIFNYGVGTTDSPDIVFNGDAEFIGNSVTGTTSSVHVGGGAIHHRDGAIVFNDDALFSGNTSASKGGAIMTAGTMLFKGEAIFEDNEASSQGGALAMMGGNVTFEKEATFKSNSAGAGAAVAMSEANSSLVFKDFALFDRNIGTAALWNNSATGSVVFENGVKFYQNTNTKNGTLQNAGDVTLNSGDFVFMHNSGESGGGLKNVGTVTVDTTGNVLFDTNITKSTGGAVDNSGILTLTAGNVSFLGNTSDAGYAGAIFNSGDMSILGAENVFSNNIAKDTGTTKHGGGAIHNRGQTGTTTLVVGTKDSVNVFSGNQSNAHGGAIVARAYDGDTQNSEVVINGDTTFVGNTAALNGGAIWNNAAKSGSTIGTASFTINGEVEFENNIASGVGGAIFNGSQMTIAKANFDRNIANGNYGGAIYNTSAGNITKLIAEFEENKVENSDFAAGGAIANIGKIGEITGEFEQNTVRAINPDAWTSAKGGAIYTFAGSVMDSVVADFDGNSAFGSGEAIGGAIVNDGTITKLHQLKSGFLNNKTEGAVYGWAGALYNSQDATIGELVANFEGNSVKAGDFAAGGAVINYGTIDTMAGDFVKNTVTASAEEGSAMGGALVNFGTIKALSGNFISNEATAATDEYASGGAISNYTGAITMVGDNLFHNNTADYGGAIENYETLNLTGRNTFTGNRANFKGAAIYNDAAGVVNMSGDNTFANNVAGKGANDIHNDGALNITDGTTTFGGGVSGNGTLTLAQGATLDIGTSLIHQDSIDLYGTVKVSLLNAGNDDKRALNYGKFHSDDITVDLGAKFELSVGAVGTYNIWGAAEVAKDQVFVGSIYEIAEMDANGVRIVTKSVDTIAEEQGLSTQASGAVVGLANANSGKAHQVSLALQEALNAGDAEYVERETKKLNPTDKPVAQAAAASVQNQVLSLASGRMAGGIAVGRAGGDESSQENGFWIQGLFNKSKMGDDFHGYTRGVALGADTLIDRKWTIGGGLATNNSDVHADGSHTDIDSKTLFLYGQYKPNNWFVNATATYNMAEYTEHKNSGGIALMDTYDVDSYGVQVMTGYDFTPGITTEAGVRYLNVSQDAYTQESGFQVGAVDTKFLSGVAGLKYAFAIENDWTIQLRPELRAAATYDFVSDDAYATVVMPGVASYQVETERLSRMGGEFGIGLTATYKGLEVSLMYDLDLHRDYTSQTGMIKFRGKF